MNSQKFGKAPKNISSMEQLTQATPTVKGGRERGMSMKDVLKGVASVAMYVLSDGEIDLMDDTFEPKKKTPKQIGSPSFSDPEQAFVYYTGLSSDIEGKRMEQRKRVMSEMGITPVETTKKQKGRRGGEGRDR